MKKFAILGLALVLVFGMSVVGLAEELDSDTIDVELTVDPYAELDITNESPIDLGSLKPGEEATGAVNYSVLANTAVTVTPEVSEGFGAADALSLEVTDEANSIDYGEGVNTEASFGLKASLADTGWEAVEADDYSATVKLTVAAQ